MARTKGSKNKDKKLVDKDPMVEEIVTEEIEFNCPIRGKVKQKVKVKRLKKVNTDSRPIMNATQDAVDALDREDDGLTIYDETEEIE